MRLPHRRILITVDLDQPSFDEPLREFIERISPFGIPLTVFSPNCPEGKKGYGAIKSLIQFAHQNGMRIEMGSHSIAHESLGNVDARKICSVIEQSVSTFREEGIPVWGFRAPYLSIEPTYDDVLSKMSQDVLIYDSSVLFEGNLLHSRLHDFLPRKCPHRVGDVWELPLSCLDDFLLYEKLKKPTAFVSIYWKKKLDTSLRHHHYFLLLIHPHFIMSRFKGLEDLLNYGIEKYSKTSFTTCSELVRELNRIHVKEGLPVQ